MRGLPPLELGGRWERAAAELEFDLVLIDDPADIRWLTGFTGSAARLLLDDEGPVLFTDARYEERARAEMEESGAQAVLLVGGPDVHRRELTRRVQGRRLGIDPSSTSWATVRQLLDSGAEVNPIGPPLAQLRRVKDAAELARIERAAELTDAALDAVRAQMVPGASERELARALERTLEDAGADGAGYPTIVASGPNSAVPHHLSSDRRLAVGDLIVIDVGAEVDGYRSDMTRSFVVGEPDEQQSRWLEAVARSQQAAIAAVRPAASGTAIDRAARSVLADEGLADRFSHGVGHGLGLVIHEHPFLSRDESALSAGEVITVEPGVYVPGVGGVRWEDTLVITETGARALTRSPQDPVLPMR